MLEIDDLEIIYSGGVKAVEALSLKIGKGIFGLIGPNGSGKSSLMRTIATLQKPTSGKVSFDGINLLDQPDQIRATLGYLPQEFGLYPNVSAESLLDHLAVLKGISDRKKRGEIVNYLLEATNLSAYRKKKLRGFSGGMKQRFGIAQALLGNPQLLILDEPTAGLDPSERNRFHNLLAAISQNTTIIFSTHIISDVVDLCNQMAIIKKGKILLHTSPEEALKLLHNKIWAKLVDPSEVEPYSAQYSVISSKVQGNKTLLKVYSDLPLENFDSLPPQLEDVYFSYMQIGAPNEQSPALV